MRHDYAPLTPPPNKRADEARAALVEYGAQLLSNKPKPQAEIVNEIDTVQTEKTVSAAPTPPTLAASLPLVAERLRGLTVDLSTARVERIDYQLPGGIGGWCWGVTVEVLGSYNTKEQNNGTE
jgi:hypothetical protein